MKGNKILHKRQKKDRIFLIKHLIFIRRCDIIYMFQRKGPLVKRLRLRPLTATSGVRFSHGSPYATNPNYFVNRNWFGFVFITSIRIEYVIPESCPKRFLSGILLDRNCLSKDQGIGCSQQAKPNRLRSVIAQDTACC